MKQKMKMDVKFNEDLLSLIEILTPQPLESEKQKSQILNYYDIHVSRLLGIKTLSYLSKYCYLDDLLK